MGEFDGRLRYSPLFYGFYSSKEATKAGYMTPLAYFCAGMSVYIFSFAIILRKMAQNSKQSKLSEKGDECTFTWKVFASWDYGIANVETAHNKVGKKSRAFTVRAVQNWRRVVPCFVLFFLARSPRSSWVLERRWWRRWRRRSLATATGR